MEMCFKSIKKGGVDSAPSLWAIGLHKIGFLGHLSRNRTTLILEQKVVELMSGLSC